MAGEKTQIKKILKKLDKKKQMKILLECGSTIGTEEWKVAIKDLMKRMNLIK